MDDSFENCWERNNEEEFKLEDLEKLENYLRQIEQV